MKLPIFARGNTEKIALAIEKKVLTYPAYIMNTDTNMYGFLDDEGAITYFKGNNKELVQRVDTLPAVSDGDTEVLYLMGEVLYSFDGEAYIPTYQTLKTEFDQYVTDTDSQLEVLTDRIAANETSISNLDTRLKSAGARIGTLETAVEALKTKDDELTQAMETMSEDFTALDTKVTEVEENISTVNSVLVTHQGHLDTIDTAIQGLDSRVDTVENQVADNNEALETVTQKVTTAENSINTLNTSLTTLSSTVDGHTEELATHDSAISHVTGEIYEINQKLEEMETTGGEIIIDDGSGSTTQVTVVDYINSTKEESVDEAKQYTDEQIQLHII